MINYIKTSKFIKKMEKITKKSFEAFFDKIIFISNSELYSKYIFEILEDFDIEKPFDVTSKNVELKRPAELVDKGEEFCVKKLDEAAKIFGKEITERTVLLTVERSVQTTHCHKHYQNYVAVIRQGSYQRTEWGEKIPIPRECYEQALDQTSDDYELKNHGLSKTIGEVIISHEDYAEYVSDKENWSNCQYFQFRDGNFEARQSLKYALGGLFLKSQFVKLQDYPEKGIDYYECFSVLKDPRLFKLLVKKTIYLKINILEDKIDAEIGLDGFDLFVTIGGKGFLYTPALAFQMNKGQVYFALFNIF